MMYRYTTGYQCEQLSIDATDGDFLKVNGKDKVKLLFCQVPGEGQTKVTLLSDSLLERHKNVPQFKLFQPITQHFIE